MSSDLIAAMHWSTAASSLPGSLHGGDWIDRPRREDKLHHEHQLGDLRNDPLDRERCLDVLREIPIVAEELREAAGTPAMRLTGASLAQVRSLRGGCSRTPRN